MKIYQETYELSNGIKIPKVGFGTWQIKYGKEAYESVLLALKHGYKHIDTALAYGNERSVGEAIKDSKILREDLFITTKLPAEMKTEEEAEAAINQSFKNLGLDYIDLYLIHAPWPWSEMGKNCSLGNIEVYKVMENYYKQGKIRAIGVSNFSPKDIENIINNCEVVPLVNQIRYAIGVDQAETIKYCNEKNIFIEAYSPLGTGNLLANEEVRHLAEEYHVSPAQICLRYLLQKGVAPLPKSTHEERIVQNTELDFVIKKEDMDFLDVIKENFRRWE